MVVIVIIMILLLFVLITCDYLQYRERKVWEFRSRINELCIQYMIRHPLYESYEMDLYYNKYTFKQMLFSIKPLKLKYWYTKEELEKFLINKLWKRDL